MKIKAKLKKGVVSVKAMAKHKMWTYDIAKKKTGSRDNANFITIFKGFFNSGKGCFNSLCSICF